MFTRSVSQNKWTAPIVIGGECDCAETSLAGQDDHLFVAVSGRHVQGNSKCSSADVNGVLDVYFLESHDGGEHWSNALWLDHNIDGLPRTSPRIDVTPAPAEAVWIATLRGKVPAANVSYWSRGSDGWLAEQIAQNTGAEAAFTMSATIPTSELSSGCSVLYLASVSPAASMNSVVRISQCAPQKLWKFPALQPVHPIVVASEDFLALLEIDALSQLRGRQYVNDVWVDKGVLINSPMPVYPAVAVQRDSTLAILAPTNSTCPSILYSWTLQPQSSWTVGGFAGCPSGDKYCILSHPRVAFQGVTQLIDAVFTDSDSAIFHNFCTWS